MIRAGRGLTRRQFAARAGAIGLGALSWPILPGCGAEPDDPNRLFVENWPAYIDPTTDDWQGSVDRFRKVTGIDLRYSETVNENQEYFARIQPRLGTGRTIEADIIVVTYWLAARLIRLGWVDPLPIEQVPNAANLEAGLRNPNWDPEGRFGLPWQSVIVGIGYNRAATGFDLGSVDDLFDPRLKGRIGMQTEMHDTIGLLALGLGIDPESLSSFAQAAPAFEQLSRAKRDGQIRAFTGNDYLDDLATGNFAACVAWAGDVAQLAKDNPDVRFLIPEEGGLRAVDAMIMPKGARHRQAAARWMDFVYDPAQAARIASAAQTYTPVVGAQAELARFAPALAADPLMFPDGVTKARLKTFANLAEDVEQQFDEAFSRIIGA